MSLARTLFGGSTQSSQSTQESGNKAYDMLAGSLGSTINQTGQASNQLSSLLGFGGAPAQTAAFDNWRNSTGYQFGLKNGMDAITGSAAAKGLLNSGSAMKALNRFGQDYASTKFNDYFNQIMGLGNMGLQAAGQVSGAGNWQRGSSTSSGSQSNGGFGGVVGSLLGK